MPIDSRNSPISIEPPPGWLVATLPRSSIDLRLGVEHLGSTRQVEKYREMCRGQSACLIICDMRREDIGFERGRYVGCNCQNSVLGWCRRQTEIYSVLVLPAPWQSTLDARLDGPEVTAPQRPPPLTGTINLHSSTTNLSF